ncbi:MAG TPA: STAS domain-containing protein [Candidatus Ozemobacteraceae bacterium]|nr:STAS domain-containing protein [Candidatus Ozemobacteraceae bacterium]
MSAFSCSGEARGGVYLLRTSGYLDESGGGALQKAVEETFPKGFRNFVLNFTGSPVINSQGIAHLIEIAEIIIDEKKGRLAFTGLNDLTMNVFKMVGLLKMGSAFPTEDAAVASFQG